MTDGLELIGVRTTCPVKSRTSSSYASLASLSRHVEIPPFATEAGAPDPGDDKLAEPVAGAFNVHGRVRLEARRFVRERNRLGQARVGAGRDCPVQAGEPDLIEARDPGQRRRLEHQHSLPT